MFDAMESNKKKMGKSGAAAADEIVFVQSDDWQTLLAQKFEIQEAQAAKNEEQKDAKSAPPKQPNSTRNSMLGVQAPSLT